MTTRHKEFLKQEPLKHEWCHAGIINELTINMPGYRQMRVNIYLPKNPIQVNELTLNNVDVNDFPMINLLLKMYLYPLKSLTINFERRRSEISKDNADFLFTII